jgi:hypothetical protein
MRRRVGLALLAALALLLAPVAATVIAPLHATTGHRAARIAPVDHHGTLAHTAAPNRVRVRRGVHHRTADAAVLAASRAEPAVTFAGAIVGRAGGASSSGLPCSSRPRAPPVVV